MHRFRMKANLGKARQGLAVFVAGWYNKHKEFAELFREAGHSFPFSPGRLALLVSRVFFDLLSSSLSDYTGRSENLDV